jgi:hypothetical protein
VIPSRLSTSKQRIAQLEEDLRRSEVERQRLRLENENLKDDLEAARRAVYRQAVPFARGTRVAAPTLTGTQSRRRLWAPRATAGTGARGRTVDRAAARRVPVLSRRGAPGARRYQYQEELPVQRPLVRRFDVHIGLCMQCRRRVQGRNEFQLPTNLRPIGSRQLGVVGSWSLDVGH